MHLHFCRTGKRLRGQKSPIPSTVLPTHSCVSRVFGLFSPRKRKKCVIAHTMSTKSCKTPIILSCAPFVFIHIVGSIFIFNIFMGLRVFAAPNCRNGRSRRAPCWPNDAYRLIIIRFATLSRDKTSGSEPDLNVRPHRTFFPRLFSPASAGLKGGATLSFQLLDATPALDTCQLHPRPAPHASAHTAAWREGSRAAYLVPLRNRHSR